MSDSSGTSVRVLLLGARRRVFFLRKLRAAASALGIDLTVLYADVNDLDPMAHLCDGLELVPPSAAADYVSAIASLIERRDIDLTMPWNDEDIRIINRHRHESLARRAFVLPSIEATRVFLDKVAFARWCRDNGIPHPRMFGSGEAPTYPCIVKPRFGQGSVGVTVCANENDLRYGIEHAQDPIVQEFIEGQEITVDAYCSPRAEVFACVPRLRIKTRGGEVMIARTVDDEFALPLARSIAGALRLEGLVNFQYIVSKGGPRVIEANPRMGGGSDLSVVAGADMPRYLLERLTTGSVSSPRPRVQTDLVMSRYQEAVFFSNTSPPSP